MDLRNYFKLFLKEQSLWESLSEDEVDQFLEFTEEVVYQKDQIIADIGEVGEALYLVIKGEISLQRGDAVSQVEVGRIKEGEIMGEMSFFDQKPRSIQLRALQDNTHVLRLTRARYARVRVQCPYIAVNLLELTIISLDQLVRRQSTDVATYSQYLYGKNR